MMMIGEAVFNEKTYEDMTTCFEKFDPNLLTAQDKEWQGMMDYAASGGQEGDAWLPCDQGSVSQLQSNITFWQPYSDM